MRVRNDYRILSGPEKPAILMLSLGEEHASRLFGEIVVADGGADDELVY